MKYRRIGYVIILFGLVFGFFSFADVPFDVDENLQAVRALDEEETQILSELFTYKQQIETSQIKINEISKMLIEIQDRIEVKTSDIAELQEKRDLQLERVGAFLRYYQRSGPNSYFEMLFTSDSIGDLIWNVNVLKDFSKNMDEAIANLDLMEEGIETEKMALSQEEENLMKQETQLRQSLEENQAYVQELSDRLNDLNDEKDRYSELLEAVDVKWQSAQDQIAFLSETVDDLMTSGYIPNDLYTLKFTLTGFEVTFTDEAITEIFNQAWEEDEVVLSLSESEAVMTFVHHDMVIKGEFEILEGYLTFIPSQASYEGLPIDGQALESVFDHNPIKMEVEVLFEGAQVKSFEQRDGLLWFKVSTGLF